jgi:hypothetical protein
MPQMDTDKISNFEFLISNQIRMIECFKIRTLKIHSKFRIRNSELLNCIRASVANILKKPFRA